MHKFNNFDDSTNQYLLKSLSLLLFRVGTSLTGPARVESQSMVGNSRTRTSKWSTLKQVGLRYRCNYSLYMSTQYTVLEKSLFSWISKYVVTALSIYLSLVTSSGRLHVDGQCWPEHPVIAILHHHSRHPMARRQTRRLRQGSGRYEITVTYSHLAASLLYHYAILKYIYFALYNLIASHQVWTWSKRLRKSDPTPADLQRPSELHHQEKSLRRLHTHAYWTSSNQIHFLQNCLVLSCLVSNSSPIRPLLFRSWKNKDR